MTPSFRLLSSLDPTADPARNQEWPANIKGFRSFRHVESGLTVNLANIAGPLYTMGVVVPTFLSDNKGLAHTLEHLIFTGSERYPQRGFLDKLAASCLSNGTNAYTADDHTNYTFSSGSGRGLLKLLPVFLDHILHPRILPETVDMEVFSLNVHGADEGRALDNECIPDQDERKERVSGQGVVYCEMKARQNSEADLLDINLRREFCARYERETPVLSRFKWECGGLTDDIAQLTREEILVFHRRFYRPSNMTIIICGNVEEDLETQLLDAIASVLKPSSEYSCAVPFADAVGGCDEKATGSRVVQFPSNEELGSLGFAWPGAPAQDLTRVLGFHVLFKFLRETSSSPLHQKFVQVSSPWATDIDYEIKPFFQTVMTLIFSGVPHHQKCPERSGLVAGRILGMLKETLVELSRDPEGVFAMVQLCLCSFELKMTELIEDDPHEVISSYTIPNLVLTAIDGSEEQSAVFGDNIIRLKAIIRELKGQSAEYWLALLQELIAVDPVEVVMIPDPKLNAEIDRRERELLHELWVSGRASVAESRPFAQTAITGDFEVMTDSTVTPFEKSVAPSGLYLVELPSTGMRSVVKTVNFKDHIAPDLWPYLVLFQELLFQCDVDCGSTGARQFLAELGAADTSLPDTDIVPYQLLQKLLNATFCTYGVNFGLDNEVFSLGYCEEAMSWSLALPGEAPQSLHGCLQLLGAIVTRSRFTADRVRVVAENLYNQIQDLQKDPYEIIDAILTERLHDMARDKLTRDEPTRDESAQDEPTRDESARDEPTRDESAQDEPTRDESARDEPRAKRVRTAGSVRVFERDISMFRQKGFLRRILREEGAVERTLEMLTRIQTGVSAAIVAPALVQLGGRSNQLASECAAFSSDMQSYSDRSLFSVHDLPKFGRLTAVSGAVAYPLGDITASHLSYQVPCNILPSGTGEGDVARLREYASISLLCQLLSVTEGPIYSRIRGRGLAYDAHLSVSVWNGLLTFAVNDSNDPAAAFEEFLGLMRAVDRELSGMTLNETNAVVSEDALKVAKSALLYQLVEERATPSSLFTVSFRNLLRGIAGSDSSQVADVLVEVVRETSLDDLVTGWRNHFLPLLDPTRAMAVLVVPNALAEEVVGKFSNLSFEMCSFRDFAPEEDGASSESSGSSESSESSGSSGSSDDGASSDDDVDSDDIGNEESGCNDSEL